MIDEKFLYEFGAKVRIYEKDEHIFHEETYPHYYYQIKSGSIKLNNYKEDGKRIYPKYPERRQ